MNFKLVSSILLILFSTLSFASSNKEDIPDVPVEVTANIITIESKQGLSLSYKNFKGWHTYWKNPGDAGLPLDFKFYVNKKEVKPQHLEWPAPKKYIEEGNMLAYGYEKEYSFFFKLKNELKSGDDLVIKSNWLVCKHICIPGQIELKGSVNNNQIQLDPASSLNVSSDDLNTRLSSLPQEIKFPVDLDMVMTNGEKENLLNLYYNMNTKAQDFRNKNLGLLTPFPLSPFTIKREKLYKDKKGNLYGKMILEWDGEYEEPEIPFPKDGKFDKNYEFKFLYNNPVTGKVQIIKKSFKSFSLEAGKRMENFFSVVSPKPLFKEPTSKTKVAITDTAEVTKNNTEEKNIFLYILFAFIGGIILNFMPCVLPVISIKLFGLIKHQNESRSTILKHNLSYSAGVLISFLALAFTTIGLKSAGESVGWGFQLQSPTFVGAMIVILFVFTLNLFGLFEFRTPGGSKLGGLQLEKGYTGDFLSGILATILSTPCSAPVLGAALTFAFTSGPEMIILVFIAIAFGLASPFILTGIFPRLVSFLPRPGMWMENFKKFLGLTLLLTTIWLYDVFAAQVDTGMPVLKLNIALAFIFFAFYMANKVTKKKIFYIPFFLISFFFLYSSLTTEVTNLSADSNAMAQDKSKHGIVWEAWSEEKMNKMKADGEIVFIDFTAKWCFTCKVNEKLILETSSFRELVKKTNAKLLLADWTKRDPVIGNWLKKNGMVGVPAYFVIDSKGNFHNLGETITFKEIEEKLK